MLNPTFPIARKSGDIYFHQFGVSRNVLTNSYFTAQSLK